MAAAPPPLALVLLAAWLTSCAGGYVPPTKYLIISNARNGTIGYVQLARSGGTSGPVRTLINKGLVHPQGLAVDQKRQLLLVADSELRKVVSYGLMTLEDGSLAVDEQTPVAEDVESRWVAVDGLGNVYLTDENKGKVLRVTAAQIASGDTSASLVEARKGSDAVSAPGGVATDNFHVFWTNKESGNSVGTVMKALHTIEKGSASAVGGVLESPLALAKNLPKAYGICLAFNDVYYTSAEKSVFVVQQKRRLAGNTTAAVELPSAFQVTSSMGNPRGCVWDGESTIFVADRSADGVFALPGPSGSLVEAKAEKVVDFEGAFGVAVYSAARGSMLAPAVAAAWLLASLRLAQ